MSCRSAMLCLLGCHGDRENENISRLHSLGTVCYLETHCEIQLLLWSCWEVACVIQGSEGFPMTVGALPPTQYMTKWVCSLCSLPMHPSAFLLHHSLMLQESPHKTLELCSQTSWSPELCEIRHIFFIINYYVAKLPYSNRKWPQG